MCLVDDRHRWTTIEIPAHEDVVGADLSELKEMLEEAEAGLEAAAAKVKSLRKFLETAFKEHIDG